MLADFCKMLVAEARLRPREGNACVDASGNGNGEDPASANGDTNGRRSGDRGAPAGNGHAVEPPRVDRRRSVADANVNVAASAGTLRPAAISVAAVRDAPHLSRRLRQTLDRLLAGDGEKQIAGHLGLSRHTVHVYIKALYRCFGVNSRGELLARFVASAAATTDHRPGEC
jgi:DNA-binding CsgD family transcriptional regulator